MLRSPTGAGTLVVGATALFLVTKLTVGLLTGSVAVLSDAVDSGQDLIAASLTLFAVRMSERPPDPGHPYGHGKIESIAAGAEASFITLGAGFITFQAVAALIEGGRTIDTGPGIVTMAVVSAGNLGLALFVRGVARRTGSFALSADAAHLLTNSAQAAAVIAGLVLVSATGESLFDPLAALLLAGYLVWAAATIARRTFAEMTDVRLPEADLAIISAIVAGQAPAVRGYHRLRSRRAGQYREIDLHLIVAPDAPFAAVHAICDQVEHEIAGRLPRSTVVIHAEPDDGRWLEPMPR